MTGSFSVDPPYDRDKFDEFAGEFQEKIDSNSDFSLDFNGEGDYEKGWTTGFCPCNHLDDVKSLKNAKKAVLDLTTQFRDFVRSKGVNCSDVSVVTEKDE